MKLLPSPTTVRRVVRPMQPPAGGASSDSLGRGMDTVITLVVFLGIGWLLDRWLGTTPWFTIGLFLLAGVGSFIIIKARYTATMEALEAERRASASAQRSATDGGSAGPDVEGHGRAAAGVPTMQGNPTSLGATREPAAS